MKLLWMTILCMSVTAGMAVADDESRLKRLPPPAGVRQLADQNNNEIKTYIVQLSTPSAAEFHARSAPPVLSKTSPGALRSTPAFNKNSAAVLSHLQRLETEQARVIGKVGNSVDTIYSYRYSLNGFAARMSAAQAHKLESMSEVLRVWEDEIRPLATGYSATFLDLFEPEVGLRGTPGLDGDGVVIGVIDSGVAPEHPAVQDTREADRPRACESTWGKTSLLGRWLCRHFKRQDDIQLFGPPENWNGVCETGPQFTAENCNNKMIGARFFVEGARASGLIDPDEIFSARDVDGHGTHIATTAAGNKVRASIYGTALGRVEGIAPGARIATYKACWLRPGATRASCNTSDLANAIDMAVADGVDIINYSVGSTKFTVTAPDDFALLAAARAGVLSVVAGGNEGPNLQTISSPAGNPAVITAAASSRHGQHSLEAMEVKSPAGVAGKYAVREAAFTPRLTDSDPIEAQLVLVDDDDDTLSDGSAGSTIDACEPLINDADISGSIAFIQRGGCDFDVKVSNADDAGAVAVVVFNIAGDPIVMTGRSGQSDIPALMTGAADGNLLLDEINNDQTIDLVLDKGLFLTVADTGNVMGNFSSRGPGPVPDVLKPDVTAPGINILAGHTPDAIATAPGESFNFLTGTSMAAPHVAGVAALLKEAHPDWNPAALKSAIMTTARQDVRMPDESNIIPFDYGSGHIDPNPSNDPGLVYDIDNDGYDAFACGIGSPEIDQVRCDDLQAGGFSFEAADLNQPSVSMSRVTTTSTITRRVTNVSENSETYTAEIEPPVGFDVQVTPSSLTIGPGQTAEFDVSMTFLDGPQDIYRFGSLTWTSPDHSVRSVLAARPLSVDAPAEILTSGASGTETFTVNFGYTGPYTPIVHGLQPAGVVDAFVGSDPNKSFSFRDTNGVFLQLFDVPADQAFIRFALFDELTDGNDDLDMFLFLCPAQFACEDASGFLIPENFFKIAESGEETSREQIDVFLPDAGTYAVLVHGFETDNTAGGVGTNFTLLGWQIGLFDDPGNMTVSGPSMVTGGTSEDITVNWSGVTADQIYLGGISHNTPEGLIALTLINVAN